jgi:hypothetical protein
VTDSDLRLKQHDRNLATTRSTTAKRLKMTRHTLWHTYSRKELSLIGVSIVIETTVVQEVIDLADPYLSLWTSSFLKAQSE